MSRRTHHASSGSRSRAKTVLLVAGAVVLVAGWVAVIAALGGVGGGGSGEEPPPEQAGQPAGGEAPATGGSGQDDSGTEQAKPQNVSDEMLSEPLGGGVPDGEVAIEDEEGRSNGQRGFVASFVGKAYGYTGADAEAYRSGYEGYIDTSTYYDSAGGEALNYYASLVENGGAENAAVLEDYTILSGEVVGQQVAASELSGFTPRQLMAAETPEGATVSEVTYAVGNRYGDPSKDEDFGEVYGEVEYLKQRLFLARAEDGGWKILAASSPQPTKLPERPDPDAPKVGYEPPGEGHHHGHEHGAS